MRGAYLLTLLVTLGCLALIDYRYHLAWWYDARRTVRTLLSGIVLFSLWDVAGIVLGIFFIGDTQHLTGLRIGQFPVEELFFLALLCYSALLTFRWIELKRSRT